MNPRLSSEVTTPMPGFFGPSLAFRERPLPPIVKWAGGKSRELRYIVPETPESFGSYFEPFVGGGAVFFALKPHPSFLNDKSKELIDLYQCVKTQDSEFIQQLHSTNSTWRSIDSFMLEKGPVLARLFSSRTSGVRSETFHEFVETNAFNLNSFLSAPYDNNPAAFVEAVERNLLFKSRRVEQLQSRVGVFAESALVSNFESAIRGTLYVQIRDTYNHRQHLALSTSTSTALFYFLREFCYASMFRYNANGHFNVPYGGLQYNRKDFAQKIAVLSSPQYVAHLASAVLRNTDFLEFLKEYPPGENDFLFLDPPYDTEFSTYALSSFGAEDQSRLAEYLRSECKANFMLVIKATDLVAQLYENSSFRVSTFELKYGVSFMDRNDRRSRHLLITNY